MKTTEHPKSQEFHPEIDGIRRMLEQPTSKVGDGLSDLWLDLLKVATEPEQEFRQRHITAFESRQGMAEARRAKVVRRLGILTYADSKIKARLGWLNDEWTSPEGVSYSSYVAQIREMYGVQNEEIDQQVQNLTNDPGYRPHYLREW